eukprot:scaffold153220_cov68-Attheya_sp.AAC.7
MGTQEDQDSTTSTRGRLLKLPKTLVRRRKLGAPSMLEIRRYQKYMDLMFAKLLFSHLVFETTQIKVTRHPLSWFSSTPMLALQIAADDYNIKKQFDGCSWLKTWSVLKELP